MNESESAAGRAAHPAELVRVAGNDAILPGPLPRDFSVRLLAYLRRAFGDDRLGYAEPPARIRGGSDTHIYRFGLSGASSDPGRTLMLRLYPRRDGPIKAVKESIFQNALARRAYPAPRVHLTCTDPSVLGGAFLVMEFRPGDLMMRAPSDAVPDMLGRAHAALHLHRIDPAPVAEALPGRSVKALRYRFDAELAALHRWTSGHPRLRPVGDWLWTNRPPEPDPLSICHGDFHPLNILVRNGEITGVLDWSNAMAADPALDVACTMLIVTIFGRRVLSLRGSGRMAQRYLESYRASRPLDPGHLDYFRVRRCVIGLMDGENGHPAWRHPSIARELADDILRITGVAIFRTDAAAPLPAGAGS